MSGHDLDVVMRLHEQAFEEYDQENPDHRHLKFALLDSAALLHKHGRLDDGTYTIQCEVLEPEERKFNG